MADWKKVLEQLEKYDELICHRYYKDECQCVIGALAQNEDVKAHLALHNQRQISWFNANVRKHFEELYGLTYRDLGALQDFNDSCKEETHTPQERALAVREYVRGLSL